MAATTPQEFIITGNFNLHLDNPSDHFTSQFLSVLSSFNLTQHVDFPTHNKSHILDLVITSSDSSLAPSLTSTLCTPSDHFPIFTKLSVVPTPLPPHTCHSFRRLHSIDIDLFLSDLQSSNLIITPPASLGSLLSSYRVAQKWHSFFSYALTSSNINRFAKLFHCQNQEKMYNNTITKDPTTPQVRRYTTL